MSQAPNLLNDDGSASLATMLLMSHHAFRRDLLRFLKALEQIKAGDSSHVEAVREEWEKSYRMALHGHHEAEDTRIFPDIRTRFPELAPALDKLTEQHHKIDPIIAKGDVAFADLAHPEQAEAVIKELQTLLNEHLAFEEANITPALRDGIQFPAPPDDASAAMFADGFAWSMQGIAPEILDKVQAQLTEILVNKLPAAQANFEERSKRVWGTYNVGKAVTPIPEIY